jgi:hypothetical protein
MKLKKTYITLLICAIAGIGFVSVLFSLSERGLHRDNSFTRRFPGHPAIKAKELDLKVNSYYIAGADKGQIYLGNKTSPLHLKILDTVLREKEVVRLTLNQDSLLYRSISLRVIPPYFFLADGTAPYIGRGNTTDWKVYSVLNAPIFFTSIEPVDSVNMLIRAVGSKTKENVLGKISLLDSSTVTLSYDLLQRQIDGLFDTDGKLLYNHKLKKLIYTYFYRNQYVVADDNLQLSRFGKTIDTISRAQIKVGAVASKNQQKMAAPAKLVNKHSATCGKYLLVNSKLVGRYEPMEMWDIASVIDVYNFEENTYEFSFYIYNIGKARLKSFRVLDDKFIGMIGNHIVTYQLNPYRFKHLRPNTKNEIDINIEDSE